MQMPIWSSDAKDIRLVDVGGDYASLNIFTNESVISVMLSREELERMTAGLIEWCGIPVFKNHELTFEDEQE
tara:strand:- start:1961 stop:2176 length:216 start_codon:yes stop_codon:yes gene_type:complete